MVREGKQIIGIQDLMLNNKMSLSIPMQGGYIKYVNRYNALIQNYGRLDPKNGRYRIEDGYEESVNIMINDLQREHKVDLVIRQEQIQSIFN